MSSIWQYIKDHQNFFIIISFSLVVYYILYFLVFGAPNSAFNKFFSKVGFINKFFSTFDKRKSLVEPNVEQNSTSSSYSSTESEWSNALEALNKEASILENQDSLEDLIQDAGISFSDDQETDPDS